MNNKALNRSPLGKTIVAAALSLLVAIGLLSAGAGLFLRDGTPLQNVAIAERACSGFAFVSERETCVRSFFAAVYRKRVASR